MARITIPGQHDATCQAVPGDPIDTRPYRGDRVGALGSFRLRTLTAVLGVLLIGVSGEAHLAAQVTNWPLEGLPAASLPGTNVFDRSGNTDSETASHWIAALCGRDCGIQVEPTYYGEVFTNARGGISTKNATQYQALLDLPVTLDFERMRWPLPGKFFLLAQNTHGRGLTEDFVGDTLVLSNIDSFDNLTQVGEYWWEFRMLDDAMTIRLGKQNVDSEFVYIETAASFVNSSFTLSPHANLPSYPNQAMAAVALLQLDESLKLKVGVWDALAGRGSWGLSGNDAVFVVGELEYTYALLDGRLPGTLSGGAGHLSGGEVSGERFAAVHGYSVQLEQLIYRECPYELDNAQGLAIFAAYYPRFPGSPVFAEAIGDSFTAGLVYTGLIPHRDKDVIGAGVAWAELFQGGTNQETVFEFFYKAEITPHIRLQPDLQYIGSPSGIHPDALAVGVRLQLIL